MSVTAAPFKPARSRLEQESVLVWNQEEAEAVLWTADPEVYQRLVAAGCKPDADDAYDGPGARFVILKSDVRLPRPRQNQDHAECNEKVKENR